MTPLPERREALLALADRCEKATGPDRELDLAILKAIGGCHRDSELIDDAARTSGPPATTVPAFTASFDAAMTLVPEGCLFEVHKMGGQWTGMAQVNGVLPFRHLTSRLRAATPALALCAAALRARSQTPSGGDSCPPLPDEPKPAG